MINRAVNVSEQFERAVSAATAPLKERVAELEAKQKQLEADLLALRRALSAKALS